MPMGVVTLFSLSLSAWTDKVWAESGVKGIPVTNAVLQTIKVQGKVVDEAGVPIIGANVVVKGTTNGTITDLDGNFMLDAAKGDVLSVTYVGYKELTVNVTGANLQTITLREDSETLSEVVVVGYGTQKKENLTGAVAAVDGDVLENRPITNIGQGLQGVVPNLNVTMSKGGAPGSSSDFNVRGNNSINGGSPLVLVDNVQMDANLVNPDDIASISVLKDAASAAIYGARAAYGVILITTKKGKSEQKPQISLLSRIHI